MSEVGMSDVGVSDGSARSRYKAMPQQRKISRREQLLLDDVERLARLAVDSATAESRRAAAMLLEYAQADLAALRVGAPLNAG
jgi:hypothetical protein